MQIVVTGGGTGGHVVPNVAVIEELRKLSPEVKISYIGSRNGIEKKIISDFNENLIEEKNDIEEKVSASQMLSRSRDTMFAQSEHSLGGVQFLWIFCGKLRRYFSWQNFLDFFKVPLGIFQSIYHLIRLKPDLIFSKGGYVSLPVCIAGFILRKKVYIHESDITPGLANRLSFPFASKILLSFDKTNNFLKAKYKKKAIVVGNPIRLNILEGKKNAGLKFCGFKGEKDILMIIGGSQGAMQINELVWGNLDELLKEFDIVHQVGKGKINPLVDKVGYKQVEFLREEMKDVYAASSIIVTRAGANSLAEIELLNKKALIIPVIVASRGDQVHNAREFEKKENFVALYEDIDDEKFLAALMLLKKLRIKKNKNTEYASTKIAKLILKK